MTRNVARRELHPVCTSYLAPCPLYRASVLLCSDHMQSPTPYNDSAAELAHPIRLSRSPRSPPSFAAHQPAMLPKASHPFTHRTTGPALAIALLPCASLLRARHCFSLASGSTCFSRTLDRCGVGATLRLAPRPLYILVHILLVGKPVHTVDSEFSCSMFVSATMFELPACCASRRNSTQIDGGCSGSASKAFIMSYS